MKTITFAIDMGLNVVWSRVGGDVAVPVLDYAGMNPGNNFDTSYNLQKMDIVTIGASDWDNLKWTKKIPVWWKNLHREFWGFALLPTTRMERRNFVELKKKIRNKVPA